LNDQDVISLQDYLVVLKRQRLLIVATVILVVVAALGVSFAQTPIYESASEVVVEPVRRTQDVSLEDLWYQANAVETERRVITSRPVAQRAAEELGLEDPRTALDGIRVETVADTRVVRIIASDVDPSAAAEKANAVANAYLAHRRAEAVEGIVAARTDLEERAASLRNEIAEMDADDGEIDEVQRDALLAQLSAVVAQAAEVSGSTDAVAGGGSVLAPAEVPTSPVSPVRSARARSRSCSGCCWASGSPSCATTSTTSSVTRPTSSVPPAAGPSSAGSRRGRTPTVATGSRPSSSRPRSPASPTGSSPPGSGSCSSLTTKRRAPKVSPASSGRSIMVSSAHAGDGKTSTAANLAVAAARVGLRTLLIDTDLRRPTVHKRFGMGATTGLTDVLLTGGDLRDHVISVGVDNLRVLPAGTIPPNPHELLASSAMRALERDVARRADLVIYDSPAVLAVPDALELGRHVDVAILVGRAGVTSRRQLTAAIERLEQVGTDVAGTVLNGIDSKNDGYYYSYYYAETPAPTNGKSGRGVTIRRRDKDEPARGSGDRAAAYPEGQELPAAEPTADGGADSYVEEPLFGDR
jgi:polysaccharide biosynthesis transport protein